MSLSKTHSVRFSDLVDIAALNGLELAGFLDVRETTEQLARAVPHLVRWQEDGFAGEMSYMRRGRELFSGLGHILPAAKSILLFLVPYSVSAVRLEEPAPGFGRVARYAWGRDYHTALREKLSRFVTTAEEKFGAFTARVFTDAVPLLERTLAERAGLGFIGKNTLLIRPGLGSFTFIAEIISTLAIEGGTADEFPEPGSGCGSCERCLVSCPTGAFQGPGRLDARRCISYLTIEKRTAFSDAEASAIGSWIFGCDICQEVCPFNHANTRGAVPAEFSAEHGAGGSLALPAVLKLSEAEFAARFAATALMRAGRAGLVRNACAVLANQGFEAALPELRRLAREDAAEVVRHEALRSIGRLSGRKQEFVESPPLSVVI